jgi:hypothetical protein
MAPQNQTGANRPDSKLGKGRRSEDSRAAEALNEYKHVMTASEVFPVPVQQTINERYEDWLDDFGPRNGYERWLTKRLVTASVQLDFSAVYMDGWRTHVAYRAEHFWDADRAEAVEALARRLPVQPPLIVARLRTTVHGRQWLACQWRALAESQRGPAPAGETLKPLDEEARRRALDLLGIDPIFRETTGRLNPPPGSGLSPADHQAALIAGQIRALEEGIEGAQQAEEHDRSLALQGSGPGYNAMERLIQRQEKAAERRFDASLEALRQAQRSAPGAAPVRPPQAQAVVVNTTAEVTVPAGTAATVQEPPRAAETARAVPDPASTATEPDEQVRAGDLPSAEPPPAAAVVPEPDPSPVTPAAAPHRSGAAVSPAAVDRPRPREGSSAHRMDPSHRSAASPFGGPPPRNRKERRALASKMRRR